MDYIRRNAFIERRNDYGKRISTEERKKWYYRFMWRTQAETWYRKNVQEQKTKSETEKLLRQAMEDYESKKFIAKADNITLGELLDIWAEEELKVSTLSNGTVENYLGAIRCIKKHPIADRKLKTVTAEHLQTFLDLLTFGGTYPDGTVKRGMSKRLYPLFLSGFAAVIPFCGIPKTTDYVQSNGYLNLTHSWRRGVVFRKR